MTVEINETGAVVAAGAPVDYATAYGWCVDNPERITSLVEDTRAFVVVIAGAESAPPEQREAAVAEAFAAGRPNVPGASWGS